jgi:HPt (histidine-containing phosphotransfer) domain-containing protein
MSALSVMAAVEPAQNSDLSVLDVDHLARMTLGDRRLESEILQIFLRQAAVMVGRLSNGEPATVAAAAHTLVGSARGIGLWRLARAAERLERIVGKAGNESSDAAIEELKCAALEASAAVGDRLGPVVAKQSNPY